MDCLRGLRQHVNGQFSTQFLNWGHRFHLKQAYDGRPFLLQYRGSPVYCFATTSRDKSLVLQRGQVELSDHHRRLPRRTCRAGMFWRCIWRADSTCYVLARCCFTHQLPHESHSKGRGRPSGSAPKKVTRLWTTYPMNILLALPNYHFSPFYPGNPTTLFRNEMVMPKGEHLFLPTALSPCVTQHRFPCVVELESWDERSLSRGVDSLRRIGSKRTLCVSSSRKNWGESIESPQQDTVCPFPACRQRIWVLPRRVISPHDRYVRASSDTMDVLPASLVEGMGDPARGLPKRGPRFPRRPNVAIVG